MTRPLGLETKDSDPLSSRSHRREFLNWLQEPLGKRLRLQAKNRIEDWETYDENA
jgi:hypothetical protein